ncbi:alpha/beta hydrolase [Paraburkholderia phytofirmans]|uniref:Dienelactone hydrolase family protein n=1 Tax=Paraburkholderia phytofirmans TaxID=261302 RepID=A0ABW9BGP9_9BURK
MSQNSHLQTPPIWRGAIADGAGIAGILVHGRTLTPDFMFEQAERLRMEHIAWCALAAHGNSWYPGKFMDPVEENQPMLDHALACVDHAIRQALAKGYTHDRIALVGFSQGACLLSEYMFRNPARWRALIAWTGGLIGPAGMQWPVRADQLKGVPVLLSNGDADPWVPLSRSRETADVFRAMGALVSERVYPARDHGIIDDEIGQARVLLGG